MLAETMSVYNGLQLQAMGCNLIIQCGGIICRITDRKASQGAVEIISIALSSDKKKEIQVSECSTLYMMI